jgi:uncharacterized protein YqjF (DUF2071 family)
MSDFPALPGFPVTAPPLPRPVLCAQFWSDLTFVHWPVRPVDVAHLYPPGTDVDVFADGMTYVGLVLFSMAYTKLAAGPAIPYFGRFAETNVRLYSVDAAGRHGVLFRSLEASRLAVVPLIRIGLGVPYTWAKMRVRSSGTHIEYDSVRRWPRHGLQSRLTVEIGEPVTPTALEIWCTARWGAHTRRVGRTWWVPNEHATWPLRSAEIRDMRDDLVEAAGVRCAGPAMRALYSPGVVARFGRPVPVR